MIIKCEHDGKSWSYDDEDLTVLQGIAVEEHIKGTLMDWDAGLASGRSVCYQALGWLIFHGASPDVDIAGVDFPLAKLSAAWLNARLENIRDAEASLEAAREAAEADAAPEAAREAKPDAAPGPTGRGSGPRSGSTSASSRKSSATSPPTSTGSAPASSTT